MTKMNKAHRIPTKAKFAGAMRRLKGMTKAKQKAAIHGASNEFIRDMTSYLKKLKKRPDLIKNATHRKLVRKHRKKLQKFIHANTTIHQKRNILTQKGGQVGGFITALVAIICAAIGAAGSIGAAATSAAISKS